MKIGEFKRRTHDDDGRRVYSTFTSRGEGLKTKRWGAKPAPKKASWRDEFMPDRMAPGAPKYSPFELAWFAFVRTFPCCAAHLGPCDGDIVAAHITLSANQKGIALKVDHQQTVAMCARHHDFWDGRLGRAGNPFADWSRDDRYERGRTWVGAVLKAAIPEDRDQAIAFEQIGIGKVIGDGTPTGFSWLPGPLTEVPPSELSL